MNTNTISRLHVIQYEAPSTTLPGRDTKPPTLLNCTTLRPLLFLFIIFLPFSQSFIPENQFGIEYFTQAGRADSGRRWSGKVSPLSSGQHPVVPFYHKINSTRPITKHRILCLPQRHSI
ncbi:hypothetical protein CDAR_297061 [Caerostris darwini]|uniref:Uncharacterized protein n=1 Tax=Caerostris darwini TaxID=1538125 RepID=A0AAV4QD52_9ARAC|nr:hypothetical protein CDAR_297061 [Caerostris darwini]